MGCRQTMCCMTNVRLVPACVRPCLPPQAPQRTHRTQQGVQCCSCTRAGCRWERADEHGVHVQQCGLLV